MKVVTPVFHKKAFSCPHCNAIAEQTWSDHIRCSYNYIPPHGGQQVTANFALENVSVAKCSVCKDFSLWRSNNSGMFYPIKAGLEQPNEDMPDDIKRDFNEAKAILNLSPRGAAALLRLAIQKLCITLGEKGNNLNTDIGNLVRKGLPSTIQQALDSVRVTGNNAVHPGVIDITDNPEIANALFGFVNVICDVLISQPIRIKEYYDKLPETALAGIEKRDSTQP